jgi:hypothetical protein
MKYIVKNEFIYNKGRKYPGDIIDVEPEEIETLKRKNVLGEPVREKIETATVAPEEVAVVKSGKAKTGKK